MSTELPAMRRIVTGIHPNGRSYIASDGPPPTIVEARPGLRNANIWTTSATPAPLSDPDRSAEHKGLYPPKNGTVIRVMDIPSEPKDKGELAAWYGAPSKSLFPDRDRRVADKTAHPGMHITDTIDYAIILFGEMHAVMDEGEVLMKAGDVLVQRGSNHAWSNRSGKVCRVAFVLIDGNRA